MAAVFVARRRFLVQGPGRIRLRPSVQIVHSKSCGLLYFWDLTQIGFVDSRVGLGQDLDILSDPAGQHLLLLLLQGLGPTSLTLMLLAGHLFSGALVKALDLELGPAIGFFLPSG